MSVDFPHPFGPIISVRSCRLMRNMFRNGNGTERQGKIADRQTKHARQMILLVVT